MSVAGNLQVKSVKKYVLQQSNCNLDVSHDKLEEEQKQLEKSALGVRTKEELSLETENQCSRQKMPEKSSKSDAKKLRSVRLDLSSLKRGVIQRATLKAHEFSSEESSEDEVKSKRKPRPVVPNYVTNSESGPCRKPRQSRQDPLLLSSQSSPKSSPQSLSIARRNARERNRVKQVNEGFATLRSRIPDYISEAYNEEKGRKSAKKLSKVETLRMAVDYIRHLETLLDLKSTDKDVWMKEIKIEDQPWDTGDSAEYQPPCVDSPGGPYDQGFEYQDRIFYDYDLEFAPRKELTSEKKMTAFAVAGIAATGNGSENDNQCVDDFKYYETFNRIKKGSGEVLSDDKMAAEEDDLENVEVSPRDSDVRMLPRDVIKKVKKSTVLPSITESFNKTIPVFF